MNTQLTGSQSLGSQSLGSQSLGSQSLGSQSLGSQSLGSQSLVVVSTADSASISQGDRGANVATLQQDLTDKAYAPGPVDGIFGQQTLAALDAFQNDEIKTLTETLHRVPPFARNSINTEIRQLQNERSDGVAGTATLARLSPSTLVTPTAAATPVDTIDPAGDLVIGDAGPAVAALQRQLIEQGYAGVGNVDGKFGPDTLEALARFQEDQIAGMESRLAQSLPPATRDTFQRELDQLRGENAAGVAGTQTQAQLENPVEVPEQVSTIRETIESFIPDFSRRSDQQKAQITEDLNLLVSGSADEKLSAVLSLTGSLDQQQLRSITGKLGVNDSRVARVLNSSTLFSSASVLTDASASDTEKLIASSRHGTRGMIQMLQPKTKPKVSLRPSQNCRRLRRCCLRTRPKFLASLVISQKWLQRRQFC